MRNKLRILTLLCSSAYFVPTFATCSETTITNQVQCLNTALDNLMQVMDAHSSRITTLEKSSSTEQSNLASLTQTVTTQGQQQIQLQSQIQSTGQNANNYADNEILKAVPAGTVVAFAGPNIPDGWLVCNGSEVPQSSYPRLYQAIGNTYGAPGNGSNFLLPDYRGLFLRGVSAGTGRDPDAGARVPLRSGASGGDVLGSYEGDMFAAHSHTSTLYYFSSSTGLQLTGNDWSYTMPGGTAYNVQTTSSGGKESRPKNVNVYYIIKI